jgi:hypothetical protein
VSLGTKRLSLSAFAFSLCALFSGFRSDAQAPPGPLPGTPPADGSSASGTKAPVPDAPRIRNLAGTWRLNPDQSDDPKRKLEQGRTAGRGPGAGGGPSVGSPGGRRGYGGRGRPDMEDRAKMQLFVEPARELTIAGQEPEIDIRDDRDRKVTAFTDGRKVEKSKDPNAQQFAAKWEDYRLVMEGKDPRGGNYQRSYEVLAGNRQLRETLLLKLGRNQAEVAIHYVYDLVARAKS